LILFLPRLSSLIFVEITWFTSLLAKSFCLALLWFYSLRPSILLYILLRTCFLFLFLFFFLVLIIIILIIIILIIIIFNII
jgi:hypothetical protein